MHGPLPAEYCKRWCSDTRLRCLRGPDRTVAWQQFSVRKWVVILPQPSPLHQKPWMQRCVQGVCTSLMAAGTACVERLGASQITCGGARPRSQRQEVMFARVTHDLLVAQ